MSLCALKALLPRYAGQVVGKEGETLDRHDRWLCMMYPWDLSPYGAAPTADDRLIGGLWAGLSAGCCHFAMVKEKRWDMIEEHLH